MVARTRRRTRTARSTTTKTPVAAGPAADPASGENDPENAVAPTGRPRGDSGMRVFEPRSDALYPGWSPTRAERRANMER